MCPERGRPPPRNNCIHLHLCMHPVSPARVTMMENNNLLLYKLLCKDKVGGVWRGGLQLGKEGGKVGWGNRGGRARKGQMFFVEGFTLCVCVYVCVWVRCQWVKCQLFLELLHPPLSLSYSLTLYSDCLQARRHFPVKVSLMNSNDPTECLWQVIHNHSSFTFPLNPLPTLPLLFLPPSRPLFLSLKKTAFPRNGHNLLSVFIYFILFFLIVHVVQRQRITFLSGLMHSEFVVMMKWYQRCNFWEWATKRQAKGHKSAQSESCFPITPACSLPGQTSCPSFTTTNIWASLILLIELPVKNYLDDTIHQNLNVQLKKSISELRYFSLFI